MLVPAFCWTPGFNVFTVDHLEKFIEQPATFTTLVRSRSVTVSAPQVITAVPPPPPVVSAAITEAYEAFLVTSRSVCVTEPKGVVKALKLLKHGSVGHCPLRPSWVGNKRSRRLGRSF